MTAVPYGWFDPADFQIESLETYLSAAKAKGVCQKKNPDDKWALYWVDYEHSESSTHSAKLRLQLEKLKFDPDPETLKKIDRQLYDKMPKAMQKCEIPEEEVDSIFDPFAQSNRTESGAGGTGLGLAICKEIITAHDGWIRAQNRPEGGCVFTFAIPRVHVRAEEVSA